MKSNKFDHLPPEDQHHIIDLCNQHEYKKVVNILAQPRPDGLAINTSVPALCRFYTSWNPLNQQAKLMEQLGKSLRVCRHATPLASLTGIVAILENNVLKQLSEGKDAVDLEKQINIMTRVHRAFISEETLNHKRGPFDSRSTYFKHADLQATELTDDDFDYNDRPREDGGDIQPMDDTTPEDYDIEDLALFKGAQSRDLHVPLNAETYKKHIEYRRPLSSGTETSDLLKALVASQGHPSVPKPTPQEPQPAPSAKTHEKIPAIPQIPPNSGARPSSGTENNVNENLNDVLTFPDPVTDIINSVYGPGPSGKIPAKAPAIPQIPSKITPRSFGISTPTIFTNNVAK